MSEAQTKAVAQQPRKEDSRPLKEVTKVADLFSNADFLRRMNNAVPSIITPTMMLSSLASSVRRSPLLLECSVADLAGKSLMLAQAALPPDTPLGLAHLIPFKEKRWNPATRKQEETVVCQAVIGYHGLLDLAYRSGKVASVIGRVAWRDEVDARMFQYEFGTDEYLKHVQSGAEHDISPQAQASGAAVMPAFAYAQASMSESKVRPFECWPWQKVEAIRNATPAYRYAVYLLDEAKKNGRNPPAGYTKAPWIAFTEKMGAKTMAKQLLNWLPRSVEYATIAAIDDIQERRSVDFGPIIDSTDYMMAAADAAETSGDAGATFGVRDGQEPASPQSTPARPTQTATPPRQPRARATPPREPQTDPNEPPADRWGDEPAGASQTAQQPPAQQTTARNTVAAEPRQDQHDAPDFEAYVISQDGEVASDAITDPVQFSLALIEYVNNESDLDMAALLELNRDAIDQARELSPIAEKHLDELEAKFGSSPTEKPMQTIALRQDSHGRPDWIGFVREARQMLPTVAPLDLHAWTDLHVQVLKSGPTTQRLQFAAAVSERAAIVMIGPPPSLSLLTPAARTPTAPAAADTSASSQPTQASNANALADERLVNQWQADLEGLKSIPMIMTWQASPFVAKALGRLEEETPEQYRRAIDLIEARKQALRAGA